MLCILNLLIRKKYESDFLKRFDHKAVLRSLSCESILFDDMFDTDPRSVYHCSQQVCFALHKRACANFCKYFTYNYTKNYYDSISAQTVVNNSRKLKTIAHT